MGAGAQTPKPPEGLSEIARLLLLKEFQYNKARRTCLPEGEFGRRGWLYSYDDLIHPNSRGSAPPTCLTSPLKKEDVRYSSTDFSANLAKRLWNLDWCNLLPPPRIDFPQAQNSRLLGFKYH